MGGGDVNAQLEMVPKALLLLPPLPAADHDNVNVTLVVVVTAAVVRRLAQWQSSGSSIGKETAASVQCLRFASWLSKSHARLGHV